MTISIWEHVQEPVLGHFLWAIVAGIFIAITGIAPEEWVAKILGWITKIFGPRFPPLQPKWRVGLLLFGSILIAAPIMGILMASTIPECSTKIMKPADGEKVQGLFKVKGKTDNFYRCRHVVVLIRD